MHRYWLFCTTFFISTLAFGNIIDHKPKIVGQQTVSVPEEQSVTLAVENLIIEFEEEPDATDEEDGPLSLQVFPGDNYTVTGSTITPGINFNGTLSVPVTVSDGEDISNSYNLLIQVTPV